MGGCSRLGWREFQAGVEVVLLGRYWVGFFVIIELFGLYVVTPGAEGAT